MARLKRLGELERAVMDHLWDIGGPQTVRQVRDGLCTQRELAYTTVMTVLHRLAYKDLVIQIREDRAYQYMPTHNRDELVAGLMVDVLDQVTDRGGRRAALMQFVERVGVDEANALRHALAEVGDDSMGHDIRHRHRVPGERRYVESHEFLSGR
ncbi:BlaI/MecI/CopY family transcriptional regulator [Mycolicibacterium helvum]|uniref:Transcriptional regulator BlaI n=1 Tax=Mycolicibacterium helvum TaxID=1534349 RepID=A0A7I7TAT9_9MYCO|nr:BlaI/MecI/CopY family transcriptional regulator [Mycolicibacterium helvum]BBY65601.1 transcriptional regulator BlaI [Mycolicibacterium helvum]